MAGFQNVKYLLIVVSFCLLIFADEKKQEIKKNKEIPAIDVLERVRAMNSDKAPKPSTKWKKGHVTPRKLSSKSIRKTENGFTIQLPSQAPVPTPTIYKGKIYTSGGFRCKEYYCFEAKTGDLVWGINLDDDGPSSAVVEDDIVVFNTESCTIFAVEALTGKMIWSWWLGDPLMTTPTIAHGRVYTSYPATSGYGGQQLHQNKLNSNLINATDQIKNAAKDQNKSKEKDKKLVLNPTHVMACFELKTGKVLWQKWIDSDVMSASVVVGDELFFGTFAGTTYKLNALNGEILSAVRNRITSAPVIVGEDFYCTFRVDGTQHKNAREAISWNKSSSIKQNAVMNDKDALYLDSKVQETTAYNAKGKGLDASNGFASGAPQSANPQQAMDNVGYSSVSTLQAFQGSRILHYDDNNYNTMGDEVLCLEPKTGKVLWSKKISGDLKKEGGFLGTSPAVAGGHIFVATLKGDILQMEPATGEIKRTYSIGSPVRYQPVIENGQLIVGTQDGKIVCINTGNKALTGWPMWGGNVAHTGCIKK